MADQLKLEDLQSFEGLPEPRPVQEQRLSDRRLYEEQAVLRIDGSELRVETVDISEGGLCVRSPRQLGVRKEVEVHLVLNFPGETCPVSAPMQVVYCFHTREGDFKVGLEFVRLAPQDIPAIQRFVAAGSAPL